MRIELVVDVPGISNPDAVDAIRLGNEVVRLVRNDLNDGHAELVHVAVGSDIAVPRDFDPSASVVSIESTDIVHDPSAVTAHVEDFHVAPFTPYHVEEPDLVAALEASLVAADHRLDYDAAVEDAEFPEPAVATPDAFNSVTDHGAPTEEV